MSIYTEPRSVSDLKECYFYHTMDLPGIGKIEGNWDLRPNLKKYLGGVDFTRKASIGCRLCEWNFKFLHGTARCRGCLLRSG